MIVPGGATQTVGRNRVSVERMPNLNLQKEAHVSSHVSMALYCIIFYKFSHNCCSIWFSQCLEQYTKASLHTEILLSSGVLTYWHKWLRRLDQRRTTDVTNAVLQLLSRHLVWLH